MATTQAAVKAALKTALLARSFISTDHIQVEYGEPGASARSETIWIGASEEQAAHEQRAFRKGLREESYEIEVHCETTAETPEKSEARAVLMADEVEDAVIDNSTLGVTNVSWIVPGGIDLRTTDAVDNVRSLATVRLNVQARLTS